jgi:nitroreductase
MIETLLKRRSCRAFTEEAVSEEQKEQLIQAALLSPSSRNLCPWEFILVEDKETLQKFGNCRKPNQSFLPKTPLAIVVAVDPDKCDVWIEDASIASIIIQLEAEKLGLASCWVQIRKRESNQGCSSAQYIKEVLNIPKNYDVLSIIAIGHEASVRSPHSLESLNRNKVHIEQF